jgi:hypothetical protein
MFEWIQQQFKALGPMAGLGLSLVILGGFLVLQRLSALAPAPMSDSDRQLLKQVEAWVNRLAFKAPPKHDEDMRQVFWACSESRQKIQDLRPQIQNDAVQTVLGRIDDKEFLAIRALVPSAWRGDEKKKEPPTSTISESRQYLNEWSQGEGTALISRLKEEYSERDPSTVLFLEVRKYQYRIKAIIDAANDVAEHQPKAERK